MQRITLTCLAGPLKGQVFHLDRGPVFTFGRFPKTTFCMAVDPAASHLHFLIDTSDSRVRIIDLGSTNGLVINDSHFGGKHGVPVDDFQELRSGDTILAGSCLFRLMVEEESTVTHYTRIAEARSDPDEDSVKLVPNHTRLTAVVTNETTTASRSTRDSEVRTILSSNTVARRLSDQLPQIEGYTVTEKIGGGGKGVIYKAIKNDSGDIAAIKMMMVNKNKAKQSRSLEMFRREIQITKQMNHPHIIRYLGDGTANGLPFLALEHVTGGNLDELIRHSPKRRLQFRQAVPLFIQILEAVAYMHDNSLVHRDIKPKNVLLEPRRSGVLAVKLSDMGLSCRFSAKDNDFLPIVTEGGTPAYMPPEQLTDLTRAVPQSDVFSAGATFYHMVTGTLLYDFTDRDQNETIIESKTKPIQMVLPDLPSKVADVINTSLNPRADQRYADANAMLAALNAALSDQ